MRTGGKPLARCADSVFVGGDIALHRNLANERFASWAVGPDRERIEKRLRDAVDGCPYHPKCRLFVETLRKDHLELHGVLLPKELDDFPKIWRELDKLDTALEKDLDFAWTPELGYLSPTHEHVGTGLVLIATFLLCGLRATGELDRVLEALERLHFRCDGLCTADGVETDVFRISNLQTLGLSEEALVARTQRIFKALVLHEARARLRLMREGSLRLVDRAWRALALAQNVCLVDPVEFFSLAAETRFAITMGFAEDGTAEMIDDLLRDWRKDARPLGDGAEGINSEEFEASLAYALRTQTFDIIPCTNEKLFRAPSRRTRK